VLYYNLLISKALKNTKHRPFQFVTCITHDHVAKYTMEAYQNGVRLVFCMSLQIYYATILLKMSIVITTVVYIYLFNNFGAHTRYKVKAKIKSS